MNKSCLDWSTWNPPVKQGLGVESADHTLVKMIIWMSPSRGDKPHGYLEGHDCMISLQKMAITNVLWTQPVEEGVMLTEGSPYSNHEVLESQNGMGGLLRNQRKKLGGSLNDVRVKCPRKGKWDHVQAILRKCLGILTSTEYNVEEHFFPLEYSAIYGGLQSILEITMVVRNLHSGKADEWVDEIWLKILKALNIVWDCEVNTSLQCCMET